MSTIQSFSKPEEKASLGSSLADLSAKTEMFSYGVEQWDYLLQAGDVTALTVRHPTIDTSQQDSSSLLGSVLKIKYGPTATAYGMMLVSKDARGQGLAKKLLHKAMEDEKSRLNNTNNNNNNNNNPEDHQHILGTCTEMGRPMYEKMGFERVSTVTRLHAPIANLNWFEEDPSSADPPSSFVYRDNGKTLDTTTDPLWKEFLCMDRVATGLDRSKSLSSIAQYPYVSSAYILDSNGKVVLGAMITTHTGSTLATVGPIVGNESCLALLLQNIGHHLIEMTPQSRKVTDMALIISDHPEIVDMLTKVGFQKAFELGAMTMNGVPMPGRREDYLALIHPTLG